MIQRHFLDIFFAMVNVFQVILISSEPHLPIDRIRLSKGLKVEVDKVLLRGEDYFKKADIETLLGKVQISFSTFI